MIAGRQDNSKALADLSVLRADYLMSFRLGYVRFLVDMSESEHYFENLKAEANNQFGDSGWSYLPIEGGS